jgi:hypothetical protein
LHVLPARPCPPVPGRSEARDDQLRIQLDERLQDECPLMQPRVRDPQALAAQLELAEEQQVQVQGAGRVRE